MRELLHAPSLVSFENGAGGENYLLTLQISSRSNFFQASLNSSAFEC